MERQLFTRYSSQRSAMFPPKTTYSVEDHQNDEAIRYVSLKLPPLRITITQSVHRLAVGNCNNSDL